MATPPPKQPYHLMKTGIFEFEAILPEDAPPEHLQNLDERMDRAQADQEETLDMNIGLARHIRLVFPAAGQLSVSTGTVIYPEGGGRLNMYHPPTPPAKVQAPEDGEFFFLDITFEVPMTEDDVDEENLTQAKVWKGQLVAEPAVGVTTPTKGDN